MSARGPPPDWLSFLAGLRPAHNDRADRPILRWQGCRGQVNVKCSADILLAHPALPDALHPLHRRRPVAPPATPELLCLSVAVADEIRFACLCATLVVLRQSLTVAPRNLNAYRVLALGHFLVRPPVDCRNLSSKALGCACGPCPTTSSGATATTSCWWKPLSTKTVTRAPRWSPTPALGPGDGLARAEWNEHEFGSAPLSNRRWRKRLIQSARIQSEASAKSFLAAARKDQAAVHVGR